MSACFGDGCGGSSLGNLPGQAVLATVKLLARQRWASLTGLYKHSAKSKQTSNTNDTILQL